MPIYNSRNSDGDSGGGGGFQAVTVNSDWSDSDNAWTDIKAATGWEAPLMKEADTNMLIIRLWTTGSNFAELTIINGVTVYYTPYEFISPPSSGIAYIIGVDLEGEGGAAPG